MQIYNKTSRKDGRSDGAVIYDLSLTIKPNEILTFDVLLKALQEGVTEVIYDKKRIYSAVKSANKKLLKKNNRYLAVVRGSGYKMISADEHLGVALYKKKQAQKTMKSGLEVLEHTVWEELSPANRIMHEQQLLLMRGLYQKVKYHDERLSETESIINKLVTRIEDLEKK